MASTTVASSESSSSVSVSVSSSMSSPLPPVSKRKRSSLGTTQLVQQPQGPGDYKIGFIGAGNMARCIAEGLLASGQVTPSNITASASSSSSENLKKIRTLGVNSTVENRDIITNSDVIILAVKPHQILDVMTEIHDIYAAVQSANNRGPAPRSLRPLIVSVAAIVTLSEIEKKAEISWHIGGSPITGHLPVIRTLPTVGSAVRAGVTAYTRGKFCNEGDTKPFLSLFSLVGHCEEVAEKYMDGFAAFGATPAFMAVAIEAMADGGVLIGIPRAISQRVAAQSMLSAAKIVLQKGVHPAEVKDSVASPGGLTIQGLHALEKGGFRGAIIDAFKAIIDRADELREKPK